MAPYAENDAVVPLSVYGRSKREGEKAVLKNHHAAVVVRTSWVYGPYEPNFVTTMLRFAERQDVVQVVSDQHGTPTSSVELAGALLDIVLRMLHPDRTYEPGIYHVSGGGETTWLGFAEAIFADWKRRGFKVPAIQPISSVQWPGPAMRPLYSRLDCSKAERVFGIRLPDWEESLEHCLDDLAAARAGAALAEQRV
jgi:dTDP-4-dehydrorhamnose reductase